MPGADTQAETAVVTGALGYTGRYIAQRLLQAGVQVKTLTGRPHRPNPFGRRMEVAPLDFSRPFDLEGNLEGASTLYNTYWVRFTRGEVDHERAVHNSETLFAAAKRAGVRRVVHISITNASESSPLPYFRGKGRVESELKRSGLSYAILRPTVIFGTEDVLINNIAWLLRHMPVFPIFGRGEYELQPVYVQDVADLAVRVGNDRQNIVVDAAGPERYTYEQLVRLVASCVGSRARITRMRPGMALVLARLLGYALRDVLITRDEVEGLMRNLLVSETVPTGATRLSSWLGEHAAEIGTRYASELGRHYR